MNFDRTITDLEMVDNVLKHQKITQRKLAEMLDVSPATISQWKKGTEQIAPGRFEELLKLSSFRNAERGWRCLSELFDSADELNLWAEFYRLAHTNFYPSEYYPHYYFCSFDDYEDDYDLTTSYAINAYELLMGLHKAGFNIIPTSFTLEQVKNWHAGEPEVSEIYFDDGEYSEENLIYYLCNFMQRMFNDFGGYESWLNEYMYEPSFEDIITEPLINRYGILLAVESAFLSLSNQETKEGLEFHFPDPARTIKAIRKSRKALIDDIKDYIEEMRKQNLPLTVDYFQILDFPNEGSAIWEYSLDGWEWLQDNYYFDPSYFARPRIEDYQSAEIKALRRMIERGFGDIHKVLAANGFKPPEDGFDNPGRHSAPSTLLDD